MHTRFKPLAVVTAIMLGWLMGAHAQTSSFFGASSNAAATVPAAAPARPSASQVWSKDDFTQKTGAIKTQNEAQYKKDFNAKLKPMPSPGGGSNAVSPIPAGSSPTPTSTSSTQATPTPTPAPSSTSSSTGSGYTGFAPPSNKSGTTTTPTTKSSGWGVTY
jgi:hypothetical protein